MIWKSVVGKLWMTIIGLVALVLVILSIWLGQFIDTDFPNTKDQLDNVASMMKRMKAAKAYNLTNPNDLRSVNDILISEDARLIVVNQNGDEAIHARPQPLDRANDSLMAKFDVKLIFDNDQLSRAQQGEVVYSEFQSQQTQKTYIAVAMPLHESIGGRDLVLVVYQQFRSNNYTNAYIKKLFVYVSVIGILLTTIFAFFLSTKITQPLFQLKKAADLIRMGQYRTRVTIRSSDEIGELANTFNHMAGELEETIKDLSDQREHLASMLRSMTDAVISVNVVGQVILANPPGERLVMHWKGTEQQSSQDIIEQTTDDPNTFLPAQIRELFDRIILESILNGTKQLTQKINIEQETWSVVLAPLYSRKQIHGAVAVLRDITEESRLEKLRKDFVANVSHELRTPLSMLQGYSEALLDDIVETVEERQALVQIIHDESVRMSRLVKDLLDLAKMEANRIELTRETVNMNVFMDRIERKFAVVTKEQQVIMKVKMPDWPMMIYGADEDRLEQVFTNLLDNGIRHTPSGKEISVNLAFKMVGENEFITIEIRDQGEGIPPEDLPYIFERFYKADKARTRSNKNSGGTGLGLSIVKNIVLAHHGTIRAQSEIGIGTAFFIVLPVHSEVDATGHFMVGN